MIELLALGFVGIIMMIVAIPLYRRKIKPNALYGLRIPATFRSDAVWYEANHLFARDLFTLGLFILLAALAATLTDVEADAFMPSMVGLMVVGVLVILAVNWRRAKRLLRDQDE
jgi:uncharacterized membrane protein